MSQWMIGAAANGVIMVAYLAIAFSILNGIAGTGQWRDNPLAVATGAIFLTCGIGHGLHFTHLLLPALGADGQVGEAARTEFNSWHAWAWDAVTAGVAVWYWTLRGRFPALVRGAALFEDMRQRQRQALEIHDNVVQGLAKTKLSLDLGRTEEGEREVEETLAASRKIISDLLGEPGSEMELGPGDLRREVAAP
jgi:hypothetical protein